MKIGRFEVEQLSEGIFDVYDNGIFQKLDANDITSRKEFEEVPTSSRQIGIDPILIRDGKHVILLDTGLGWGLDAKSNYSNTSNLKSNLDIFGLTLSDVTHVILTHLHFDHSAGCTYVDYTATTQPTLPYANYFVQKLEWHYAVQRMGEVNPVQGSDYNLDEFYKLYAEEKLVLITDTTFELLPGITLIKTGGHTPGHQIVKIQDGGETAYFLGDLVPDEYHLNNYAMKEMDIDPIQSKKAKTLILRQAVIEKAAIFFYHSIHIKNGVLVQDEEKRYALLDVK